MVLRNAPVLYIPLHTTYMVEGMRSVLVLLLYLPAPCIPCEEQPLLLSTTQQHVAQHHVFASAHPDVPRSPRGWLWC